VKNRFSASQLSQTAESIVITLACEGDSPAFSEIVRRSHNWVRNFMLRLCNHTDLADDLAQQVFLKAWKSIHQLRSPDTFYGWLKTIMVSVWLDDIRRNRLDFTSQDKSEQAETYNATPGERIDLDAALTQLPPPMRLCVVLAYNDGLSHSEISAVTKVPVGTVKSNISRGAAKLRTLLSDYRNVD